jgi:iron complex transport system substrate-binding protein
MGRPKRILSLAPNVSMTLFALGADDTVVGRTGHCLSSIRRYLAVWQLSGSDIEGRLRHWEALPEVDTWPGAEPEKVLALEPELILTSGTGAFDTYDASAFNLGPDALINFDIRTLADLDRQIVTIGEVIGRSQDAAEIVRQLASRREVVLAGRLPSATTPKVLFEYCVCIKYHPDPAERFANPGRFVMVGGHLAPELIRLAGGEPLFALEGDSIAWTDFRRIRDAQPDIILTLDCGGCASALKHPVAARPGWPELAAVSGGSVFRPSKNIANPNLCYVDALAELMAFMATWEKTSRSSI